jgi:hypothetical protein
VSVIGLIIYLIAQLGYAGFIRMFGVSKYMAWITSIIVQTMLLYILAMFGWLKFGMIAVTIVGCLFVVTRIVMIVLKKGKLPFEGMHYFDIWFVAVGLLMVRVLFESPLIHYDNYSHWALIVKYLLLQGHLPNATDTMIAFTSYPPATALFITQFVSWVGFSDGAMLVAQYMIIWAALYATFGVLRDRTRVTYSLILCFVFSLVNVFNISIRMNNLLVDCVLPVVAAAGFAGIYAYRHHPKLQCVTAGLFGAELFLIKNSGTMYVVMIGCYLVYSLTTNANPLVLRRKRVGKALGWTALSMALSYAPFFWWNQHVHATFSAVSKHQISTKAYASQLSSESSDVITKIGSKFLHQVFNFNSLSTRGVLLINITLFVAWLVILVVAKKRNNLLKTLIAIDVSFIAYYFSVFAMYIVSMPYNEAINLDGSERYLSSMVILNLLLGAMALVVALDRAMLEQRISKRGIRTFKSMITKNTYQISALVLLLFSSILILSETNGIKYNNQHYKEELPVQLKKIDQQTMKYSHTRILLVDPHTSDVSNYYAGYVGRYYFFSDKVEAREDFDMSKAAFKKKLSEYKYVALPEWHRTFTAMLEETYHQNYKTGMYKVTKDGLKPIKKMELSYK